MEYLPIILLLIGASGTDATTNNKTKIVGGYYTNILNFPYQLQLNIDNAISCGGSILSANWAMTAAHCLLTANQYWFRAGSSTWGSGGTLHQGYNKIVYPYYNSKLTDYDIALSQVYPNFPIGNPGVAAISLPLFEPYDGNPVTVSGWGRISGNGPTSVTLKAANLNIISRASCNSQLGYIITGRMICAQNPGNDPCNGDSGGPLVYSGSSLQYGIVSFGQTGCNPILPSVYTNVAFFRQWINSYTGV